MDAESWPPDGTPSLAGTLSHLTILRFLRKPKPDEASGWAFPEEEREVLKSVDRQSQRRRRVWILPCLLLALGPWVSHFPESWLPPVIWGWSCTFPVQWWLNMGTICQ